MVKILFICLGNICRSSVAETILRAKLSARNLDAEVDSAGLISYHQGEQADPRMRAHAARHGYNITHLSRPITPSDFEHFDLIIGMDEANMRTLRKLAPKQYRSKLHIATEFCTCFASTADCVPDPYYGGDTGFEYVIDILEDVCEGVINYLRATQN